MANRFIPGREACQVSFYLSNSGENNAGFSNYRHRVARYSRIELTQNGKGGHNTRQAVISV
jgi:hypothetical protein